MSSDEKGYVDVHNHPYWYGHNPHDLIANMDHFGIEQTWLLSWETDDEELANAPLYHDLMDPRGVAAPLGLVLEAAAYSPDRLVPAWAPNVKDRHARRKLRAAVDLHGVRICGELKQRLLYNDPDAIALFRYCGELGLPVLFHLECPPYVNRRMAAGFGNWEQWYGGDIATVDDMCARCPDTVFIGHGPGFWREFAAGDEDSEESYPVGEVRGEGRLFDTLRRHPNLYADVSANSGCNALTRDTEFAAAFLDEFQDRVLFGRDHFHGRHIQAIAALGLRGGVHRKIMRENAAGLLERGNRIRACLTPPWGDEAVPAPRRYRTGEARNRSGPGTSG